MIKRQYDADSDTFSIVYEKGVESRYEEPLPGLRVEYGERDQVIGIEIENYSRFREVQSLANTVQNHHIKNDSAKENIAQ